MRKSLVVSIISVLSIVAITTIGLPTQVMAENYPMAASGVITSISDAWEYPAGDIRVSGKPTDLRAGLARHVQQGTALQPASRRVLLRSRTR